MVGDFLREILEFAVQNNASDVHFSSGKVPRLRIMGEFKKIDMEPPDHELLLEEMMTILNDEQRRHYNEYHELDLALSIEGLARFRINLFDHFNGIAGAFRIFPRQIRTLSDLMLPAVIENIIGRKKGIILVTGPAGSGKSTTIAAMVNHINSHEKKHIVTIEDPIEYLHESLQCLVHQREIGLHTQSYTRALINALREDPDIIMIGEMRDQETVLHALQAAETGQLVFSTLHTNSAAECVDRIVDIFPANQHKQVLSMLANTLVGVVSQRLVPMAFKNDRIGLLEILVATPAVQNLIRENKSYQIHSAIQTGSEHGMVTFEKSFSRLQQNNLISSLYKLENFV